MIDWIAVSLTTDNLITDFFFDSELDYGSLNGDGPLPHDSIGRMLADNKFKLCSVIILAERMDTELYDDPAHCIKTNHLWCSELEAEARKDLVNKYYTDEQIAELCQKYDLKTWKTNDPKYQRKDGERDFKFIVQDALFETQERLLWPELIEQMTGCANYVWEETGYPKEDENGDYIPLEDEDLKDKQYKIMLEKIMMPRVHTQHERRALMPKPFDYWDWRNPFQQYYFWKRDDKIYWVRGGSGSSGAREHQGRYAHIFACAENHGSKIQTFCCKYDKRNRFVLSHFYDCFKAINRELMGNYPASYSEVKQLFKGKLLGFGFEDYEFFEVKDEDSYY